MKLHWAATRAFGHTVHDGSLHADGRCRSEYVTAFHLAGHHPFQYSWPCDTWRHIIWLPVNNRFLQNDYRFCLKNGFNTTRLYRFGTFTFVEAWSWSRVEDDEKVTKCEMRLIVKRPMKWIRKLILNTKWPTPKWVSIEYWRERRKWFNAQDTRRNRSCLFKTFINF